MRIPLAVSVLVLCLFAGALPAQTGLWSKVSSRYSFREVPITLRPAEANAIRTILRSRAQRDPWQSCDGDPTWVENVKFTAVKLSPAHKTVMVEAGSGCARGGQGANGAMWIVQLDGPYPRLLASPKGDFSGWPYSIESSSSHGFRDVVIGWHMSAAEAGLSYFRFDGRTYRSIGHASLLTGESGEAKIVPGGPSVLAH